MRQREQHRNQIQKKMSNLADKVIGLVVANLIIEICKFGQFFSALSLLLLPFPSSFLLLKHFSNVYALASFVCRLDNWAYGCVSFCDSILILEFFCSLVIFLHVFSPIWNLNIIVGAVAIWIHFVWISKSKNYYETGTRMNPIVCCHYFSLAHFFTLLLFCVFLLLFSAGYVLLCVFVLLSEIFSRCASKNFQFCFSFLLCFTFILNAKIVFIKLDCNGYIV